jgi:hypothetical protein
MYGIAALSILGTGEVGLLTAFIHWTCTAFVSLLVAGTLFVVRCAVTHRSDDLRQLAQDLEAEHQARYGELPREAP